MTFDPWDQAAPFLQAALDQSRQRLSLEDVKAAVESGAAHLWLGQKSAAVTEQTMDTNAWLFGGDLEEAKSMLLSAEAFAAHQGCKTMTIWEGRPGWERVLKSLGYEKRTVLVKEL
ncbi:MAG: hypothetical protein AAFX52_11120 [Pseudomonadota bacterium]